MGYLPPINWCRISDCQAVWPSHFGLWLAESVHQHAEFFPLLWKSLNHDVLCPCCGPLSLKSQEPGTKAKWRCYDFLWTKYRATVSLARQVVEYGSCLRWSSPYPVGNLMVYGLGMEHSFWGHEYMCSNWVLGQNFEYDERFGWRNDGSKHLVNLPECVCQDSRLELPVDSEDHPVGCQ